MTTLHGARVPQNRSNCGRESRFRSRMVPVRPATAISLLVRTRIAVQL
jgi:hypothetical protein